MDNLDPDSNKMFGLGQEPAQVKCTNCHHLVTTMAVRFREFISGGENDLIVILGLVSWLAVGILIYVVGWWPKRF